MLAIVLITYKAPLDAITAHTPAHRAYLAELHAKGALVASGPFIPRTGGALLLRAETDQEIAAIIANDPFHTNEVAEHEVKVWAPTIGAQTFDL